MIKEALIGFNDYRRTEGAILEKDFIERINIIGELLKEVEIYEEERCNKIKAKLTSKLKELSIEEINETQFLQTRYGYVENHAVTDTLNYLKGKDKQILYLYFIFSFVLFSFICIILHSICIA